MDAVDSVPGCASKERPHNSSTCRVVECILETYLRSYSQAAAASSNPLLAEKAVRDPTLACTGYKRPRFYMFTRSEPE